MNSVLLELAEQYAELKGTKVIAHAERDNGSITFVLQSGQKLTKTADELRAEIKDLTPTAPTAPPQAEPPIKRGSAPARLQTHEKKPPKKGKTQ